MPLAPAIRQNMFYSPNIDIETTVTVLSEEESMHCVKVLRYTRGDEIELMNGTGGLFKAVITNPHPKHCEVRIISAVQQPRPRDYHLHIAVAPTKNIERMEWMVEKCTEIGIDEITPLLCHYSERKQLRTDRLEKIILSAAKQSLNTYLPRLNPLTPFDEFISNAQEESRFIAHCYKDDKRRELKDELQSGKSCLILIGPEGDFSEEEVRTAISKGYITVLLGSTRLRTETAAIVACHTAILMKH